MLSSTKFAGLALLVATLALYAATAQAQEQGSKVLAKGKFHKVEKAGEGTATVYKLSSGKRILRLSNFQTDNGPDLHVRLIAADDATDTASAAKAAYVELGKLKGNKGNQNYDLSADLNLDRYKVVSIWCNRFSVNFAAAPLKAPK
jgi:hypothetical protein